MTSEPNEEGPKNSASNPQKEAARLASNQALRADPNNPYLKGLTLYYADENEESLSWFDKAIEINPNDADSYCFKGQALQGLKRYEEAMICFEKAIEINPQSGIYLSAKADLLSNLERKEEAIECYDKAIEVEPDNATYYENKILILQGIGKTDEAELCNGKLKLMKLEKATFHSDEGKKFQGLGKYEEAVNSFDEAINTIPETGEYHLGKGIALRSLGKLQEALACIEKAIEIDGNNPLYYCVKGKTLRDQGKPQEAKSDLKKAWEIIKSRQGPLDGARSKIPYIEKALNLIFQLEKEDKRAEKISEQLDKNNLIVAKMIETLKGFSHSKEKMITELLSQIEKRDSEFANQENIYAALKLKDEYEKLQKEMKEKLDGELVDFYKQFNFHCVDFDLSEDDQSRVKDYFEAFIGTFSSVFDGSKSIESGQSLIDAGCLLSTFASFAPFVDENLLKESFSIGKFLKVKEIKGNARKILELFFDSVYLNAVIGRIAEKIVFNKAKREDILSTKEKKIDSQNEYLLQKISKFCEQMTDHPKIDLYRKLYNTPTARLGHMDANDLIQEYCEGKIRFSKVEEEFVERTVKRERLTNHIEETNPTTPALDHKEKKSLNEKCCSIF